MELLIVHVVITTNDSHINLDPMLNLTVDAHTLPHKESETELFDRSVHSTHI